MHWFFLMQERLSFMLQLTVTMDLNPQLEQQVSDSAR